MEREEEESEQEKIKIETEPHFATMKDVADARRYLATFASTDAAVDKKSLHMAFLASTEQVKNARPSTSQKLVFYGLYKQAERGDAPATRPSLLDRVACAKHDAWVAFKGVSADCAKRTYIAAVDSLLPPLAATRASPACLQSAPVETRGDASGFDDRAAAAPLLLEPDGVTVRFTPKVCLPLNRNHIS